MPTYLYACRSCGERFERTQRISDDPVTECPECQGQVGRVPQAVGIVFKGSGFYKNDSRSASETAKSNKDTNDAAPAAVKTDDTKTQPAAASSSESPPPATPTPSAPPAAGAAKSTGS